LGRLSRCVLRLLGGTSGSILGLLRSSLRGLLGLPGDLTCGLLGLLERLVYRVHHPEILGRLVKRVLDGLVGVGQLLDLRLRFFVRDLLRQALQLGAVLLEPALELPDRAAVEVLGALYGLLLDLLLQVLRLFSHFLSFGVSSAFCLDS
jgi:hypothetical protein